MADGIIGHLYGPEPGSCHNSFLLSHSKLSATLSQHLSHGNEHFVIYGDPAYGLQEHIVCPYKGSQLTPSQQAFNTSMSSVRICVEWGFGKIVQMWAFVDFSKRQKLFWSPCAVHFKVATILTNLHTCYYGTTTSSAFETTPPSPMEYLHSMPQPQDDSDSEQDDSDSDDRDDHEH